MMATLLQIKNKDYFEDSDYGCSFGEDRPREKDSHAKEVPAVQHEQIYHFAQVCESRDTSKTCRAGGPQD